MIPRHFQNLHVHPILRIFEGQKTMQEQLDFLEGCSSHPEIDVLNLTPNISCKKRLTADIIFLKTRKA